jgi:hypothetical protein
MLHVKFSPVCLGWTRCACGRASLEAPGFRRKTGRTAVKIAVASFELRSGP